MGECDLRRDPRQRLVLRHDSFEQTPWTRDEAPLTPATAPEAFARHARALKLDLKDRPGVLDEVLALVQRFPGLSDAPAGRAWEARLC